MKLFRHILKSTDDKWVFYTLIISAFSLLNISSTLTAQCRYLSNKNPTQTRLQKLIKGYGVEEALTVKIRYSDNRYYLDVHFKTTESTFSIKKGATLTLIFNDDRQIVLQAKEMLHADSYHTCCDTVWLMEVAYFIPKEQQQSLLKNNIREIRLALDNRNISFHLKNKKQRKIRDLLKCFL